MSRPAGARSRWIGGDIPPNEPGVYERRIKGLSIGLNYFDGKLWRTGQRFVNRAPSAARSVYQVGETRFVWRGRSSR